MILYILLGVSAALVVWLALCCCKAASDADERDGRDMDAQ